MPIYLLNDQIVFPPVEGAEDGIVAIGGDLTSARLVKAYSSGIFPWFSDNEPILWWSPDPRFILLLDELHISKSMRRVLNSDKFTFTFDKDFKAVIERCKSVQRKEEDGTWITAEMKNAYIRLHEEGIAHSVEVWLGEEIVGGIYGVTLGKCFFAESMFHTETNASKFALIKLVEYLKKENFHFLDAQVYTEHVSSLGAKEISRTEFIVRLEKGIKEENRVGKWNAEMDLS